MFMRATRSPSAGHGKWKLLSVTFSDASGMCPVDHVENIHSIVPWEPPAEIYCVGTFC